MFVEKLNSYSDFSEVVNEALNEKLTKELNHNGYFAELEYYQSLKDKLADINEEFALHEEMDGCGADDEDDDDTKGSKKNEDEHDEDDEDDEDDDE